MKRMERVFKGVTRALARMDLEVAIRWHEAKIRQLKREGGKLNEIQRGSRI